MTENRPFISVIIPVYNIEEYLERCVRSVMEQTWTHMEILLVDDGSTDGSSLICDNLAGEDGRIRVFHKKNGGSSSARNVGIDHASGEYIGFVDSDDYISPGMYECMIRQIQAQGCSIVQVSRDEIDENGLKRPDVCMPPSRPVFMKSEDFLRELLMHRGDCSFCTKLVRRELFAEYRFPEGTLNEDFRLLLQLLSLVDGISILPGQLYHVFYRIGSNTRMRTRNEFSRVYEDIVVNADYAARLTCDRYPALHTEAVRFGLCQRLDYLLHIPVSRMKKTDPFYTDVKKYLRSRLKDTITNPLLTAKQRIYLLLLTAAPHMVRRLHCATLKARGI